MRRTVLATILAAVAAVITSIPAGSGTARPLVWVALEDADQIALVNVRTGTVLRREATPGGPHNITVASDGTVVVALWDTDRIAILRPRASDPRFVTLGGAPHDVKTRGSTIVVANQGATHVDRTWLRGGVLPRIGLKAHPHDLAIAPGGRRAWVSLEGSDDLAVVDLDDRSVRYVSTGVRPHDLLFAHDGRLWVTDWNGTVHVFDGADRIRTLRLGEEAHHLAFTPDGDEVWITDHGVGKVFVLSTRPIALLATRDIPGEPHHVSITANGRWAVIADHTNGTLVVFDARTHRRARIVRVGAGPHGVWAVPA
ncbi:MAG: hypothetical protein WD096_11255 [Actinomycetota bacterium]